MSAQQCPNCERWNVSETLQRDSFPYKSPTEGIIRLHYTAPMFHCRDCGMNYTDEVGEEARAQAVRDYLRTPRGADER